MSDVKVGSKRKLEKSNNQEESEEEEEENDIIVGPSIPEEPPKKKRKKLKFEKLFLDSLPSAEMYEKSYMHRKQITHVRTSTKKNIMITASLDGHVKFWRKKPIGIEFIKHFRAHLEPIINVSLSHDGLLFATISTDKTLKIFDVLNFDMINLIELDFLPSCCEWSYQYGSPKKLISISDSMSEKIHIFEAEGDNTIIKTFDFIHDSSVVLMKYNEKYDTMISVDIDSTVEYWSPKDGEMPEDIVKFNYIIQTDLLCFKKNKNFPLSLTIGKKGKHFGTITNDKQIIIFDFLTGKIYKQYDEATTTNSIQNNLDSPYHLEAIDFGRRMAVDREITNLQKTIYTNLKSSETIEEKLDALKAYGSCSYPNIVFDDSDNFILYPSPIGIKMVNLVSNKLTRVLGLFENNERFLSIDLYQGKTTGVAGTKDFDPKAKEDPTLICSCFKKQRFYLFSKREPEDPDIGDVVGRDVYNERPTEAERSLVIQQTKETLGENAIIHTTYGDMQFELYPDKCPKTVENFVTLSKKEYYNGLIFHRVIKGFMIQTGDPLGDGTGGESIYGHDFEDEFHPDLKHKRAGTLSMANAGPNTNGSQFFITTVPIPRLDNKHTVFGNITKGLDVAHLIEKASTDSDDKPYEDIKIINIEIF